LFQLSQTNLCIIYLLLSLLSSTLKPEKELWRSQTAIQTFLGLRLTTTYLHIMKWSSVSVENRDLDPELG
jgi:hypothetical protein